MTKIARAIGRALSIRSKGNNQRWFWFYYNQL